MNTSNYDLYEVFLALQEVEDKWNTTQCTPLLYQRLEREARNKFTNVASEIDNAMASGPSMWLDLLDVVVGVDSDCTRYVYKLGFCPGMWNKFLSIFDPYGLPTITDSRGIYLPELRKLFVVLFHADLHPQVRFERVPAGIYVSLRVKLWH